MGSFGHIQQDGRGRFIPVHVLILALALLTLGFVLVLITFGFLLERHETLLRQRCLLVHRLGGCILLLLSDFDDTLAILGCNREGNSGFVPDEELALQLLWRREAAWARVRRHI